MIVPRSYADSTLQRSIDDSYGSAQNFSNVNSSFFPSAPSSSQTRIFESTNGKAFQYVLGHWKIEVRVLVKKIGLSGNVEV